MRSNSNATSMNIRIDRRIKESAKAVFAELGLDLSTAVNIFFRQAIRENGIPFKMKLDIPNAETRRAIKEAERGEGLSRTFDSAEEMFEELGI